MLKIEQAIQATTQIGETFNDGKYYCLVEIFHNSFFYSPCIPNSSPQTQSSSHAFQKADPLTRPEVSREDSSDIILDTSAFTMLDGTDGMSIRISTSIDSLYSYTAFESWESIQRLHGYSTNELKTFIRTLKSDAAVLPLIFVTTLHLRYTDVDDSSANHGPSSSTKSNQIKQLRKIKDSLKKGLNPSYPVAFFDSLDTANLIIIINSSTYSDVVVLLEETLAKFPGMISNTHVGLLSRFAEKWSDVPEKINRYRIQVALKDTSNQATFVERLISEITSLSNCEVKSYSNLGVFDIVFEINGKQPLSSDSVVKGIKAIQSAGGGAFYDFTINIENIFPLEKPVAHSLDKEIEPTTVCALNRMIVTYIADERKGFEDKYQSEPKPSYATAIYLLDILNSIAQKILRACEEGHVAPLVPMMLSALNGFKELFSYSYKVDPEYALISLSKFVTELYYVYRSSMYGIVEPQMLDGVSLFRDIPERLVENYYNLIDSVSYIIRGENSPDSVSKFFYLLVPGVSPSVRTDRLFCSEKLDSRLLIIHFPRIMLFKARTLIPSLIHEIAHYSGDTERRRPERQNTIFDLVAYFILHQIDKRVTNPSFMYMKQLLYRNFLSAKLEDSFYTNHPKYDGKYDGEMLDSLKPILRESFYRLFDFESIQGWALVASDASEDQNSTPEEYLKAMQSLFAAGFSGQLLVFINSLVDIFSEVYADIIAVYLLQLSFEDYLHMLWQNGNDFSPKTSIQERIQIVAQTCWGGNTETILGKKPLWLEDDKFEIIIHWRKSNATNVFPHAIREHIVDHFRMVGDDLREELSKQNGEHLSTLREKYGLLVHSNS